MKKIILFVGIAILLMFSVAQADQITFYLGVGNAAIADYPGPYASVTIDLTSATTAVITFEGLVQDAYTYLLGKAQMIDLNVNANSFTVDGSPPSAQQADGFGHFNATIDGPNSFNDALQSYTLTLVNILGSWSNASQVLVDNATGYMAAAHIIVDNGGTAALATGYAGNGVTQVPEPNTMILIGSGLLGFALYNRRRFKK
jgi:hypothetical protein